MLSLHMQQLLRRVVRTTQYIQLPQVSGFAGMLQQCGGCPDTVPRISTFLSSKGVDANGVIAACAAQLMGI